jgi:hypothetical protein
MQQSRYNSALKFGLTRIQPDDTIPVVKKWTRRVVYFYLSDFSRKATFLAGLALFGSTAASRLYGDVLYGITNDDNLISVNTANPAASTLVGALDTASASLGIFSDSGDLFVYDTNSNVLRQILPSTAATVSTINIGLLASPSEGDVAFHAGVGYLLSNLQPDGSFNGSGTLFKFTLSPGSATVVATNMPLIDGLAFSSTGTLYGLAQGGASLYTINTTTGAASAVGAGTGISDDCGGFPCYGFGGLSFDASGNLFAALTNFANANSNFFSINPGTGTATAQAAIPFDQVSGLTSFSGVVGTSAPEPSTLYLLAAASLLGVGWKRLRPSPPATPAKIFPPAS